MNALNMLFIWYGTQFIYGVWVVYKHWYSLLYLCYKLYRNSYWYINCIFKYPIKLRDIYQKMDFKMNALLWIFWNQSHQFFLLTADIQSNRIQAKKRQRFLHQRYDVFDMLFFYIKRAYEKLSTPSHTCMGLMTYLDNWSNISY